MVSLSGPRWVATLVEGRAGGGSDNLSDKNYRVSVMLYFLLQRLGYNRRNEKRILLPFTKNLHLHPSIPSRFSSQNFSKISLFLY